MKLIGIDPGLGRTGWGVIFGDGVCLRFIASGTVATDPKRPLADRLLQIAAGLEAVLAAHRPAEAAVEATFVNSNAVSTLKLGQARGTALLTLARAGLSITEYLPNTVKKAVAGFGHAGKPQVQAMVRLLLAGAEPSGADAADALAVAICHAHHRRAAVHAGAPTR